MSFADFYFGKYKYFPAHISSQPNENLKFIIIIPCFNEPEILKTLISLKENNQTNSYVEIIVLINSPENCNFKILKNNSDTYKLLNEWNIENSDENLKFFVQNIENLPSKIAGAGLARKIAMDEALRRFNLIGNNNGYIISLDADTICDKSYLSEIEKFINSNQNLKGFTLNFEHPIYGNEFDEKIYSAIALYELYLRYYNLSLKYTGFPYSFHTIGSAFGVRADIYASQGGMNTKQAGEDFYFLHKIIPLGNFCEIKNAKVYPSPRISNRVPFGTGVVIEKIIKQSDNEFLTYNFEAFRELKNFFSNYKNFSKFYTENEFKVSDNLCKFLEMNNFYTDIVEINNNCSNLKTFSKRFFQWFDAFRVLKFLNFAHEKNFSKEPIFSEVLILLKELKINIETEEPKKLLEILRKL